MTDTPELYEEARIAVITERKCSASFVQRRFSIGYNKAARLVETLEAGGVVGPADHVGKRAILIDAPADAAEAITLAKMLDADDGKKPDNPFKPDPEFDNEKDRVFRVTAGELRSFVERFERLAVEKKDIADQQKEVMAEAKSRGYSDKVLRMVIALRKRDPQEISETEAVLDLYKDALGM